MDEGKPEMNSNGFTQRTLFVHCKPAKDDGVIRMNGYAYAFTYTRKESLLRKRKMLVWVVELPPDMYSSTQRIMVYLKPEISDNEFIGFADYRPPRQETCEDEQETEDQAPHQSP